MPLNTAQRCPKPPRDLQNEASSHPAVEGKTAEEVAGRLIVQQKATRNALRRSLNLYYACLKTR